MNLRGANLKPEIPKAHNLYRSTHSNVLFYLKQYYDKMYVPRLCFICIVSLYTWENNIYIETFL